MIKQPADLWPTPHRHADKPRLRCIRVIVNCITGVSVLPLITWSHRCCHVVNDVVNVKVMVIQMQCTLISLTLQVLSSTHAIIWEKRKPWHITNRCICIYIYMHICIHAYLAVTISSQIYFTDSHAKSILILSPSISPTRLIIWLLGWWIWYIHVLLSLQWARPPASRYRFDHVDKAIGPWVMMNGIRVSYSITQEPRPVSRYALNTPITHEPFWDLKWSQNTAKQVITNTVPHRKSR